MKKGIISLFVVSLFLLLKGIAISEISDESSTCISCHESIYPGIVSSWEESKHSKAGVGCFECHGKNKDIHKDTFEHNGFDIHVVVTPRDCSGCHKKEAKEYSENMMSFAYDNLMKNSLYMDLEKNINFIGISKNALSKENVDTVRGDSCLYCHGTKVDVVGLIEKSTMFGKLRFPNLSGWPNQGVGRLNPDGSNGSCSSCHPRHSFSIEIARKPYTCAQCHKGPDVPAYKVYIVSKHGNIFKSIGDKFNFKNIPWVVGKDFQAPTCATCHMSEISSSDGDVIVKRTHKVCDRLSYRIFGNPYAHPHPLDPRTYRLKNKEGIQIPVSLDGSTLATSMLIDKTEMAKRRQNMTNICKSCHSTSWAESHFDTLETVISTTNNLVANATTEMIYNWNKGVISQKSLFDEPIEKKWTELWLFYANSIRFSAAMSGGGDYGVFANGRFFLNKNLIDIHNYQKK